MELKCSDDLKKLILNTIYPIGSIYVSMNSTNPKNILGGTWTQITNRFLYCTTSSKGTGGSNYTNYHQLTLDQVPPHYHDIRFGSSTGNGVTISNDGGNIGVLNVNGWNWTDVSNNNEKGSGSNLRTNEEGGGGSHRHSQNLPPYITCYAWYRTA